MIFYTGDSVLIKFSWSKCSVCLACILEQFAQNWDPLNLNHGRLLQVIVNRFDALMLTWCLKLVSHIISLETASWERAMIIIRITLICSLIPFWSDVRTFAFVVSFEVQRISAEILMDGAWCSCFTERWGGKDYDSPILHPPAVFRELLHPSA